MIAIQLMFYLYMFQISQVLVNFMTNALKFTPAGGTVQVHAYINDDTLHVEVIDSGIGISQDNQKRVFNEAGCFITSADHPGGAGLGLWISKKIIDLHGGTIGASSAGEGLGSTFYFTLPIREMERRGSMSAAEPSPQSREGSGHSARIQPVATSSVPVTLKGRRVLVVDDSELIRKMLTNRFEKEGCVVHQAEDGDVAVEIMRNNLAQGAEHFDIITMDNVGN